MKIDRISQIFGMDLQKVAGGGKSPEKTEKTAKSDSVSLSKKAKELSSSSTESIRQHVDAMPDVRADKVQEVKEKIASGYFNSPDFEEKLADRLMKEFGF
ncbi:MAG: flagellar biosynthesis anti-sigma factor FlgM [Fibrobacteria bacterium]